MTFDKNVAAHYEAWYETPEGRRADELEKAINPKTRALLINSPNNPSAVVYGEDVIRALAELLDR